jgi:hypothetical protein
MSPLFLQGHKVSISVWSFNKIENFSGVEQLQRFCIFYLAKDGVCQLSNQYGEEKKSLSPTVWQN